MEDKVEIVEVEVVSKQYKVRNASRDKCKIISAISLEDLKENAARIFNQTGMPRIQLDEDGTIVEDEGYFQFLGGDTEFIAVFENEKWIDPAKYMVETSRISADMTDSTTESATDNERLRKIVPYLQKNPNSIHLLSDPDLEIIAAMDKEQLEGLNVANRNFIAMKEVANILLYKKRTTAESIELLKWIASKVAENEDAAEQQQKGDESTSNSNSQ